MESLVVVVAVLVGTLGGAVAAVVMVRRSEPSWLDGAVRRRLLVQTRDGQTIDGLLVRVEERGVVLGPATLADGPHELDGEVWVPRERVAWVQRPTERDAG